MPLEITVDTGESPTDSYESVRYWLNEISSARKREKDFRTDGQRILDIYGAKKDTKTPFNILFSNTETLLPALYSAVPRPLVQRRFKDDDPLGKAASTAGQRMLEFLVDTNVEGYETFDEGVRAATLDGLLPGRGVTCLKYDADMAEGSDTETTPYLNSELVCVETRSWNRVLFGYAKKWSKVPWIAFEEHIDKREATRLFGKKIAKELRYSDDEDRRDRDDDTDHEQRSVSTGRDESDKGQRQTALVYQIWDKAGGKKIRYLAEQHKEAFLKVEDDPLQLTGFYNCPRPLQFVEKSNDLLPTAMYLLYENQAKELNRLTNRLQKIVEAIKARGIYAGDVSTELGNLMKGDDNELVPAESTSSLAFEKGLQNAIWMLPIAELIVVAEKLYAAREQCKQVIYEITGIADIMRGATKASETLGAQQLKVTWGSLRLKRQQKEVQRYARDLLRMMLDIAAAKFSEETWAKMTGLPYLTTEKFQQLTAIAKAAQQQASANPALVQQVQQNPQAMTQVQQIQQQLQLPQWAQVLKILQDDVQRAYRIDIETNSTLEPEAAEDHKEISEMMTAMGQFLNGVAPLVAKGVMPYQTAQSMMLAISRRFRFGTEIEEYIKQMQAPKPEDDGKAATAQLEQAKLQATQQQHQATLQQQGQVELATHQREVQAEQNKMALAQSKLQSEQALEQTRLEHALQIEHLKAEQVARTEKMKIQLDSNAKMAIAKLEADTKIVVAEIAAKTSIQQTAMTANAAGPERETELSETGTVVPKAPLGELLAAVNRNMLTFMEVNQASQQMLFDTLSAPRTRRAIRGKDGRIEAIQDTPVMKQGTA